MGGVWMLLRQGTGVKVRQVSTISQSRTDRLKFWASPGENDCHGFLGLTLKRVPRRFLFPF